MPDLRLNSPEWSATEGRPNAFLAGFTFFVSVADWWKSIRATAYSHQLPWSRKMNPRLSHFQKKVLPGRN